MLAEGLQIMSGGAEEVGKRNLERFAQTLDSVPWKALESLYHESMGP